MPVGRVTAVVPVMVAVTAVAGAVTVGGPVGLPSPVVRDAAAQPSTAPGHGATARTDAAPRLVASSPYDSAVRLTSRSPETGLGAETVATTVTVDPTTRAQEWWGTGAALTDASVDVLDGRPDLVSRLFAPRARTGARLTWLRLPLTATDLSTTWWGWRRTSTGYRPAGPGRRAIGVLRRQILPVAPDLRVVASPWSAPPSMKTGDSWLGGRLRSDAVPAYARMLVAQARWLVAHDVPLKAITVANEPGHAADYPTMQVSDADLLRLARLVLPSLRGLGVRLWGLDHNWSDAARVAAIGGAGLDAVAFHCYAGTPSQAGALGLPWLISECTGTTDNAVSTLHYDATVLLRDAIGAGSRGLLFWNLALAPGARGAGGGCTDCRGLLTVSGEDGLPEPEFYVLAHLARAAPVGSRVVAASLPGDLPGVAFRKGRRVGVVAFNDTDVTRWVRFSVAGAGDAPIYRIGPRELVTFTTGIG